ncbi:hypothetical protein IGI04_012698 [Brassica rapa subsp. trilocularis]|uniref:Uncharacterized protein n=1 Tax=Brassica rapa subsp. trilocularis TaxID=1813537 RepID=A0ABQ7N6P8_BRACM|nr:hypothetical protein IGI04_012294 [Brassica rapa subsp. trilocularis]KAG5406579.1 hypothetical protein IGI04_012698 [Brassica rapa subsp. trilocularis]
MTNLGLKMMRNLGSGCACAKFGRSERWYCVSRREKISFSTPPEVTFSTPPSLVSLLFTSFFGYLWYQTKVCLNLESPVVVLYSAASEQERLWDVLSEKRNQIRILSRQDESKRKKVKQAEIKLIEKAATVLSEEIQV